MVPPSVSEIISEPCPTRRERLKLGIFSAVGLATANVGFAAPVKVLQPAAKSPIQIWSWGGRCAWRVSQRG